MYGYVAENDPYKAKAICHKYGYKMQGVNSKSDLGLLLEQLVAKEGEPALRDIVLNHPDRELIVEMEMSNSDSSIRALPSTTVSERREISYADFVNYIGEEKASRNNSVSQTNTFLLATAFILGVAIITSKK